MRRLGLCLAVGTLAAGAATFSAAPASAVCSVFDRRPCNPTSCSVFQRRPCIPEIQYPIGQDLRLTIETMPTSDKTRPGGGKPPVPNIPDAQASQTGSQDGADPTPQADHKSDADHKKLDTIRAMFDALRECWVPPAEDQMRAGMQMSVRLAFKRTGEIIGTPRVTYTLEGVPKEVRETYHQAITEALERCTPLPFTAGLGGAVAGRPVAIRFVDNRKTQ